MTTIPFYAIFIYTKALDPKPVQFTEHGLKTRAYNWKKPKSLFIWQVQQQQTSIFVNWFWVLPVGLKVADQLNI